MTYVSGNSKEIRGPSALQAMDAAEVEAGTPEGTVVSAIGIAISVLISLTVMTLVAIAGNFLLHALPEPVVTSLKYLRHPCSEHWRCSRVVLNPKVASVGRSPCVYHLFPEEERIFLIPSPGRRVRAADDLRICLHVLVEGDVFKRAPGIKKIR